MLRKFAAVLLATSMVAGAAYAAEPGSAGAIGAGAGVNTGATFAAPTHPTKPVKHARKQGRKHVRKHHVRGKAHGMKQAHHFKGGKSHKTHVARVAKAAKEAKHGGVKTAKLPATRSSTN